MQRSSFFLFVGGRGGMFLFTSHLFLQHSFEAVRGKFILQNGLLYDTETQWAFLVLLVLQAHFWKTKQK